MVVRVQILAQNEGKEIEIHAHSEGSSYAFVKATGLTRWNILLGWACGPHCLLLTKLSFLLLQ